MAAESAQPAAKALHQARVARPRMVGAHLIVRSPQKALVVANLHWIPHPRLSSCGTCHRKKCVGNGMGTYVVGAGALGLTWHKRRELSWRGRMHGHTSLAQSDGILWAQVGKLGNEVNALVGKLGGPVKRGQHWQLLGWRLHQRR